MDRAIAADSRNATAYLWRGLNWLSMGFFDRANADLDRSLALEPGYLNAKQHKALALLYAGQTDAALALFQRCAAAGCVTSVAVNFVSPLAQRGNLLAALMAMDSLGLSPAIRERLISISGWVTSIVSGRQMSAIRVNWSSGTAIRRGWETQPVSSACWNTVVSWRTGVSTAFHRSAGRSVQRISAAIEGEHDISQPVARSTSATVQTSVIQSHRTRCSMPTARGAILTQARNHR
jgi:hypothetical protein